MKVLKSIFSKIFVLALILGVAISFAGCKKDTNKTENVQIEANFPNVRDARQIEEAFDNLVNMATQYANKQTR